MYFYDYYHLFLRSYSAQCASYLYFYFYFILDPCFYIYIVYKRPPAPPRTSGPRTMCPNHKRAGTRGCLP